MGYTKFNKLIGGKVMSEYGKIFRLLSSPNENFDISIYNPVEHSYFDVVQKARSEDKRQIVINSELMTLILYKVISTNGFISKIDLADSTDEDIKQNITILISKIRTNPVLFVDLKKELEWAYDSGSIDIFSITVIFEGNLYKINSNGLVEGKELQIFFDKIIQPILKEYFE